MMVKKCLVPRLAERTMKLVANGNRHPTVQQVLRPLNGKMPPTWRGKALLVSAVRRYLYKSYGLHCCGVSTEFYQSVEGPRGGIVRKAYKDTPPNSEEEAKKCLPGGSYRKLCGLHFPQAPDEDLVYEEHLIKYGHQAAKHYAGVVDKLTGGMDQKILSERTAPRRLEEVFVEHLSQCVMPALDNAIERAVVKRLESHAKL